MPKDQTGRVNSVNYNANGNRFLSLAEGVISVWTRSPSGRYSLAQTLTQEGGL